MTRNYSPENIKCPLCNTGTQLTNKGIIFKHSYPDPSAYYFTGIYTQGARNYSHCNASKLPLIQVEQMIASGEVEQITNSLGDVVKQLVLATR